MRIAPTAHSARSAKGIQSERKIISGILEFGWSNPTAAIFCGNDGYRGRPYMQLYARGRKGSGASGREFHFGRRTPETDGWVSFGGQPDHVDGLFGASADAVFLAAAVAGQFENRHPVPCLEAGGPAGGDTKTTAGAEFIRNRGEPLERVFVFHDYLDAGPSMKCPFADLWHRDRRHSKQK